MSSLRKLLRISFVLPGVPSENHLRVLSGNSPKFPSKNPTRVLFANFPGISPRSPTGIPSGNLPVSSMNLLEVPSGSPP